METLVLAAEPRACTKNEAQKLRKEGKVPVVVYHKGEENAHISVDAIALEKIAHSPESHIINLKFPDGATKLSLIKELQLDPVSDKVIHADFQFFTKGEIMEMEVPLSFSGKAPGIVAGGKMQVLLHSVTVKGAPSNIPDHLDIDISAMELGDTMHLGQIPEEITGGKFEVVGNPDTPVVSITAPRVEAEGSTEAEAATAEEGEA
ncbi:50S ribosomal protein L25/general stress protein Ctc [Prosthecochloris vibrioformis]|uniref:Large ribosomal subunit protein bL25 n=1 Tax=Prosthecochloris vibrioformis TaxID=1098 RepID=A0A5C4S1E6_PROVB|nr:50S ribosomal protein L25/general stress protein Ctc [Prosthecochloris vibrioformis]TNJ37343.1 50S ribosomal protein L25/general stress protein Ctc [Prosthecochloris vibrioformis]